MEVTKRDVLNLASFFNYSRIVFAALLTYLIFDNAGKWTIAIVFSVAALTDAADGFVARRYNLVSEYGRRADIIADRIFMTWVVIMIVIYKFNIGQANILFLMQIIMIMSREIIGLPFSLIASFRGDILPHVRKIGKITTILQGFTFPMIILNWQIALYLAMITCITGVTSGIYYAYDSVIKNWNKKRKIIKKVNKKRRVSKAKRRIKK